MTGLGTVPNPLANKALWWASGLLVAAGVGFGAFAGWQAEDAWVNAAFARATQIARSIERNPLKINEIALISSAGGDTAGEAIAVFDPDLQRLVASAGANAAFAVDGFSTSAMRALKDSPSGQIRTGSTVELIVPVGERGRPAAWVWLSAPIGELRQVQRRMFWTAGLVSLAGLAIVFLYFSTADRRLRRQRQLIENVLPPSSAPFRRSYDDELTALERQLRELPPHWDGLSRQAQGEAALRELVLKTMTEALVAVNREMHVTFCNENFMKAIGSRSGPPVGQHLLTAVRTPEFLNVLAASMRDQEAHRTRIDLNARRFEVQASPMKLPGGASGALAVLRDVTELERLERVRRDFVTNISHELRTPLAAIQGYAETLLEGSAFPDESSERRFLATIQRHALRLSRVAADLATLSEIEGSSSSEPLEPISLPMVVSSACRAMDREAETHDVRIEVLHVPEIEVYGHRLRLEQALINLLDNGIRFNRAGGEVRVETELAPDRSEIQVSLIDSGIGIPRDQLSRIFERFYRVDKARSRETGGTGLGLSIVRHVAEQMHGRVQVESTLGRGSKFTLILPVARYDTANGTAVERAPDPAPGADVQAN